MRRASDFLYVRLYKTLKEQILSGLIKPGDYLLAENDLCKHYRLSRNSVRKALEELHKEGLVVKKVGLGTMVPPDLKSPALDRIALRIAAPFPAYFVDYGFPVLCEAFRRQYPHVDVHVLSLPADTFHETLLKTERLGVVPDLILLGEGQFVELQKENRFLNLEPVIRGVRSDMYPRLDRAFCAGTAPAAVPVTFSPVCLAINPELFHQSGATVPSGDWSFEAFADAAHQTTVIRDGRIAQFGFSLYPTFNRWLVFALQNGLRPNASERRLIIGRALDTLQDLLHRKRIATVYTDSNNLMNPFVYGKSAMSLTTLFEMSAWNERGIEFTPHIVPLPFGGTASTVLQTNLLAIPEGCSNPQLASAFIETALAPDIQRAFCEQAPFLSVLESVNASLRTPDQLRALNIGGDLLDHAYFLHELLDPETDYAELVADMSLFWLGLEDASTIAERF